MSTDGLVELLELAGFATAHAVWSVSDGAILVPIAMSDKEGQRKLVRFVAEELPQAVEQGRAWLEQNPDEAEIAVLVFDGYVSSDSEEKTDALILEGRSRAGQKLTVVQRYRPASDTAGFAVHRPQLEVPPHEGLDDDSVGQAFFRGLESHEEGARVWSAAIDEGA
jgi:hypothetical protein